MKLLYSYCTGLLALFALTGCERPFVDVVPPAISLVSPDLDEIRSESMLPLVVRATSFRDVHRVEVNGRSMVHDASADVWIDTLHLPPGLTALHVTAFDAGQTAGRDTLHVLRLPARYHQAAPEFPQRRGGHTATLLPDGSLIIAGGSAFVSATAARTIYVLPPGETVFRTVFQRLAVPRTNHSATLLPDGRILLIGGSFRENASSSADFVELVEVYDPRFDTISEVPVTGATIRRILHTQLFRSVVSSGQQVQYVFLYGGRAPPEREDGSGNLDTRRDVQTFLFRNDSLIALNVPRPTLESLAGHAQVALNGTSAGSATRYLVFGSHFNDAVATDANFAVHFTGAQIGMGRRLPPFRSSRTRHAAGLIGEGRVLIMGGHRHDAGLLVHVSELYLEAPGRFFRFGDEIAPLIPRWGHAIVPWDGRRVLITGGFNDRGDGLRTAEWFELN